MHFSARSIVPESVENPLLYYKNNVADGISLVQSMLKCGVTKMIFSSTAAVYGLPESVPIEENAPTCPITPYGKTKLAFEQFLADCSKAHGLQYISLRYFNAAGASELHGEDHRPETHLIPLVLQVARGKRGKIQIYGNNYPTPDGTCIRDYIHVQDLADAHLLAAKYLDNNKSSHVFNLGNEQGFSVLEVIDKVKRITGKDIPSEIAPPRAGDPPVLIASSEKIAHELGWKPANPTLESIIDSAWKWHLKFPQGYSP
jgi:UDP-glucose 4-epimerase